MSVGVAITSIVAADPAAGNDTTRTRDIVEGTLTLSGNYGGGATHGDTVSFVSPLVNSTLPPVWVEIREDVAAGNVATGFQFIFNSGTTQANGVLQVLSTSAAPGALVGGIEFTQGAAYSTGTPSLNGAVLRFKAWFPRGV